MAWNALSTLQTSAWEVWEFFCCIFAAYFISVCNFYGIASWRGFKAVVFILLLFHSTRVFSVPCHRSDLIMRAFNSFFIGLRGGAWQADFNRSAVIKVMCNSGPVLFSWPWFVSPQALNVKRRCPKAISQLLLASCRRNVEKKNRTLKCCGSEVWFFHSVMTFSIFLCVVLAKNYHR